MPARQLVNIDLQNVFTRDSRISVLLIEIAKGTLVSFELFARMIVDRQTVPDNPNHLHPT